MNEMIMLILILSILVSTALVMSIYNSTQKSKWAAETIDSLAKSNTRLMQELMKVRNPEVELAALRVKEEMAIAKAAVEKGDAIVPLTERQFQRRAAVTANIMPGDLGPEELEIMSNGMGMG